MASLLKKHIARRLPMTTTTTTPAATKPPPSPPTRANKVTYPIQHVHEAQLLVAYAAKNGLEINEEMLNTIVCAKHWLQEDDWDAEKEARFWIAFNKLAQTVAPVSIASLRATHTNQLQTEEEGKKSTKQRSIAEETVDAYKNWSFLVLAVLLIVQAYWLVGSTITKNFVENVNSLELEKEKLRKVESDIRETEDSIDRLELKIDQSTELLQETELELRRLTAQLFDQRDVFDEANSRIDKFSKVMNSNKEMLDSWNTFWQMRVWFSESTPSESFLQAADGANMVLQIIQLYILPLLYGLLGAFAYVLRSISIEIRNLTYEAESNISYRLRVQLGLLSGLAVGWFIDASNPDIALNSSVSFTSLSPMALAFLAGYSVEVLFALMDRLILAFSTDSSQLRKR